MFDFLKRKKPVASNAARGTAPPLYFKDNQAAFECACEFMNCTVTEGCSLPALVTDFGKYSPGVPPVKIEKDGRQIALLAIASEDYGFLVAASTAGLHGPRLKPGQLVAWQAGNYVPAVAEAMKDKRFGWVGLIMGTLKPEHVNGSWVGDERFYN